MIDVKGKAVFLSGPVTGLDRGEACGAFLDARKRLRGLGAQECFIPTELVPEGSSHEDAMLVCLSELTCWTVASPLEWDGPFERYDMLVSLPGWQDSAGARLEREVAEACGIPCFDLAEVVADE